MTEKAEAPEFGMVWCDQEAIANTFGFADMVEKCCVACDSEKEDAFLVHMPMKIVKFKCTPEGPCEFKEAQKQYPKHVAALEEVLKGKNQTKIFTQKLKEEMKHAANLQQYERAKDIRDTLIRLGSLQTKQKMEYVDNSDEEYFGIGVQDQTATVMNFRMINGVIRDSDKFFFDLVGDNTFSNFIFQYYSTHKIPKVILVSELPENKKLLESLLSDQAGFRVQLLCPTRGKRKEIINLILKNVIDNMQSDGIEFISLGDVIIKGFAYPIKVYKLSYCIVLLCFIAKRKNVWHQYPKFHYWESNFVRN